MSEKKSDQKILIICPICSKSSTIPVPADLISHKGTGATSILIPPHTICNHTFHAYVDKNLAVRDYLVSDISLVEQKDSYDIKKKELQSSLEGINIDLENVLKYISEKDLLALIYACMLDSPLIFIEHELSQPRFEVLFAFLLKLFPEILTTSTIMPSEKFIDYEIKYATELKHYTIYNPETTPHIRKPFTSEETEPLQDIFKILRAGVQKIQRVHAKNYIDYLKKFAAEIQAVGEDKIDKAIKKLKKDHPNQQDLITPPLIGIMQKRNEFLSKFSKV